MKQRHLILALTLIFLCIIAPRIFAATATSYADPMNDISTAWSVTNASTHFAAINDTIRQPTTPNITNYISTSTSGAEDIINITPIKINTNFIKLWVYSQTGSNARTNITIQNASGNIFAELIVGISSSAGWRSITWNNKGAPPALRLSFLHTKSGSGAAQPSTVYAAYLEVNYNNDTPIFYSQQVNASLLGLNEVARFKINITDNSTNINFVNGTIGNVNYNFFNLSANLQSGFWYNDWVCNITNPLVNFTFIYANDTLNNVNSTTINNVSVNCDVTPPAFTNATDNATVTFNPNAIYQFNITVTDNVNVSQVVFQFNNLNYSTINTGSLYQRNISGLSVGSYVYNWFMNDTVRNANTTSIFTLTINQASANLSLYLNNVESNLTTALNTLVNITGMLNTGSGNISLYLNGTLNATGTSPITALKNFTIKGLYNISLSYLGNTNYTSATKEFFINVIDNKPPAFTNPTNLSSLTYNETTIYQFNITVSDDDVVSQVLFQFDNRNYSISGNNNLYSINLSGLSAGSYIYKWFMNDSSNNANVTTDYNFTITPASSNISLYLSSIENNLTIPLNTLVNITGIRNAGQSNLSLFIANVLNATGNPVQALKIFTTNGIYNITLIHNSNQNYTYSAKEFEVIVTDIIPPTFNNLTNYSTPSTYNEAAAYQFNSTVIDDIAVDAVLFQFNDKNYTTSKTNNLYTTTITGLSAGSYLYKWFANDTSGNTNATALFTLTITQASSDVSLLLNGLQNNLTVALNTTINLTGIINTGVGNISLYINGILNATGNSPITSLKMLNTKGIYNASLIYQGNQNYTFSSKEFFITVIDNETPSYTSPTNYSLPFIYNESTVYQFNISVTDDVAVDQVLFQFGNRNHTTSLTTNNIYTTNITGVSGGIYTYKWFMNDTSNNINGTSDFTLTIEKAAANISLYINDTESNHTTVANTPVNLTAILNIGKGSISLYINNSLNSTTNSPLSILHNFNETAIINITTQYLGNENFTYTSKEFFVNVTAIFFPDTTPPIYENATNYSEAITFNETRNYQFNITVRDDIQVDTVLFQFNNQNYSTTKIGNTYKFNNSGLATGSYNYKWYMNDTSNNVNITPEFTLTITQADSSISLYLNNTENNITTVVNTTINITTILNIGQGNLNLYIDNILNTTAPSPLTVLHMFNQTGIFNITTIYLGSQNYTPSSKESFVNVTSLIIPDTIPPVYNDSTTYAPVIFNENAAYQFNITVTDNVNVSQVVLQFDNKNYTTSNTGDLYTMNISGLSAGFYNYKWFMNDTSGNTNVTSDFMVNITQAPSNISLYLNGTESNMTIPKNTTITLSGILNLGQGNLYLYIASILEASGNSPLTIIRNFNESGIFNASLLYLGNENYTFTSKEFFVNVTNTSSSSDTTPPTYSNPTNYSTPFIFNPNAMYQFNITVTDDISVDGVVLQFNNKNYTTSLITSNTYAATINGFSVGTYSYKWFMNDTSSNSNSTPEFTLTITQANATVALYLDSTRGNITKEVNTTINITGLLNAGTGNLSLLIDGILEKSDVSPITLLKTFNVTGLYNISLLYHGNENYTFTAEEWFANITSTSSDSGSDNSHHESNNPQQPIDIQPPDDGSKFDAAAREKAIGEPKSRKEGTKYAIASTPATSPTPLIAIGTPVNNPAPAGTSILGAAVGLTKKPSLWGLLLIILILLATLMTRKKLKKGLQKDRSTRLKNTELHQKLRELGFEIKEKNKKIINDFKLLNQKRDEKMQVVEEQKDINLEEQRIPVPQILSPVEKMKNSIRELKTHFPESMREVKEKRHLLRKPHTIEVKKISHSGNVFTAEELAQQFPETFGKMNIKKIKSRVIVEHELKKTEVHRKLKEEFGYAIKQKVLPEIKEKASLQPEKKIESFTDVKDIKANMLKNLKEAFKDE